MKDTIATILGVSLFIALAVAFLVLLRQTSSEPSVILTSTQCNPPCWYGIQPGKTSYLEVTSLLEQINGLNEQNILWDFDTNDRLTSVHWTFQRPIDDSFGYIYFDDDKIVNAIKIYAINSIKVSDVFGKLGEPEQYWTEIGRRGNQEEYLEVFLLYPTKGYLVNCVIDIEYGKTQVELMENTPVFLVTYFFPEDYNELLDIRILIDKPTNTRSGSPQPWPGLGFIPIGK